MPYQFHKNAARSGFSPLTGKAIEIRNGHWQLSLYGAFQSLNREGH